MKMRRTLLASLTALAVLLAACGSDDADDAASTTEPTGSDGSAEEGELDPDAVFRYAWVAPTSMDPHKSSIASDQYMLYPIYDRLVHQSPDVEPVPGLAESWEWAPDGSYLELSLREGVVFQDGEPFDAEAVRLNIERGKALEGSAVKGDLAIIEEVEVVDELTVRMHVTGPAASLPMILSAQPGMMISPAALDDPALDQNPVGAGMYRVTAYEPGVRLEAEAWDEYWDQEAQLLGGIEVEVMPDFTARLNALRSGDLDAARLEPAQASEAESAGLEVLLQDSIEIGMLSFNRAKAPLDDPLVRQALNHAIDRQGIVDGLFFGLGTPAVQVYPEGFLGHADDRGVDTYEFDPEKARELLGEAGYADGFSMEVNVAALDFVVAYAEAIQAQLAEVGVDVTINPVELSQYGQVVYVDQNGHGTATIGAARPDPSQTALQFQPDAFTNPGGASSPEVEALYAESLDPTLSAEDREAVLEDLSRTLVDQAFSLVIFHPQNPWGHSDKVVGLDNWRNVIELRGVGMRP